MPEAKFFVRAAALALAWALAGSAAPAAGGDAPGDTPRVALALEDDGTLSATGTLPRGLSRDELSAALPGIELAGLERDDAGPGWDAAAAIEALAIVLPRFRTAGVQLGDRSLAMQGVLASGLSAAGVEAALLSALGPDWHLDLQLDETAPAAEIVLTRDGERTTISGLLPRTPDPSRALEILGPGTVDAGLAGGGESTAVGWSDVLAALGETLDLFAMAEGRVRAGEVLLGGVLRPGFPRDAVEARLSDRLPAGWTAALSAEETPPNEGDRRVNLETGTPESFRQGYWLPDVSFPVSPERCRAETEKALGDGGLPFADGEAEIEPGALALLSRLAAIAVRCLNSSSLHLEIAAHTDSVGNDARNEALSQARADAIRRAIVDRGVRAEAVTARGYGEHRPVATNNTPAGRAQNRRIDFDWSAPEG